MKRMTLPRIGIKFFLLASGMVALFAVSTSVPASASSVAPGHATAQQISFLGEHASTMTQLQSQVDLQMKLYPGGKQTATNEVSYNGGGFVVTYAMPGSTFAPAAADCPTDWFCFYDHTNYGYPRGKLSDCGWQDLAAYGWQDRTESFDDNTFDWIDYIGHQDYGNPANGHRYDEHLFWSTPHLPEPTVPNPNAADHVQRDC